MTIIYCINSENGVKMTGKVRVCVLFLLYPCKQANNRSMDGNRGTAADFDNTCFNSARSETVAKLRSTGIC